MTHSLSRQRTGGEHSQAVKDALAGHRSYDTLNSEDQETVRAEWAHQIPVAAAVLDLRGQFLAEGRGWVETDKNGTIRVVNTPGQPEVN